MRNHNELRICTEFLQIIREIADVRVIQRSFDLIQNTEWRGFELEHGEQQRNGGQRALAAGEQAQKLTFLSRRLNNNVNAAVQRILRVHQEQLRLAAAKEAREGFGEVPLEFGEVVHKGDAHLLQQTLNQLLVEMDGFVGNEGVVVLAATNRADILDPALLRPGRFDRQVYVGHPDIKGREEVLKIHVRNKPLSEDVDLRVLAQSTPGFTGADLENLVNEGALLAARKDQKFITMDDLKEAVVKVIAGPEKKSRVVPQHERKLTAYHEAGHAILHHCLASVDAVHQVTIIPRGKAGGMTISLPAEDRGYYSKRYMEEEIASLLGGRVAEAIALGDISTGASNDIQRATDMARRMVTVYGMSDKLGAVCFDSGNDEVFIGRSMAQAKNYSEEVAAKIDAEVKAIIDSAYRRCETVLTEHRDALERVAQCLLEKETISGEEFAEVMGFPKAKMEE